jgi:chemotaxis methyl-accepting protein methylase
MTDSAGGAMEVPRIMRHRYESEISMYDDEFLERTIQNRMSVRGIADGRSYARFLENTADEASELKKSLRISYSEFFRDPLAYAILERLVLPELLERAERSGRTELRIWSAGCADGQEPYSLAILLESLLAGRASKLGYRIFASDISETALSRARSGLYGADSLGNVRRNQLETHFVPEGCGWRLSSRIRDRVDFSIHSLLDERSACPPSCVYSDLDLVFCSNVLFYYKREVRRLIVDKIAKCLSPEGYFITGETERELVMDSESFAPIVAASPVFRKNMKRGRH